MAGLEAIRASRGLATGDLDGDGDLDIAVNNSNDWAEVYENLRAAGGYLQLDLVGRQSSSQAEGAWAEVESEGHRQVREVRSASSYLSQSAATLHFGVAGARRVERLTVRWPMGRRQALVDLPANRRLRLLEPR